MKVIPLLNGLKSSVSILFFIACATYVAIRGYKCFVKYSTEPQSNRISYKFNARVIFPSISFCPTEEYRFKVEELNKCELSTDDYFIFGQWIGKSKNSNCTGMEKRYSRM